MTPKDPSYIGNQADIINRAEWAKGDGLLPAIIQNPDTGAILMLGYMNKDAYEATIKGGQVTFFSRSKQRLWTKGETSGNTLDLVSVELDCDNDTLLIMARPNGPTCHTGTTTCFNDKNLPATLFLNQLQNLIVARHKDMPQGSYTTSLFTEGKARIAQKVGEEGVELALARMKDDSNEVTNEAADLLFHMMVLLQDAGLSLGDVIGVLQSRHKISS
ncbi:bifunctional phosphoribosyl-AMP cyclohydrolase/phosphoribosyl-ATP diphosphatase HisIE [Alphaproteobacteria bacterium]|nr:bifunctional phosphoribosyl-AMP cyclohydrolase/phosphoribosyl-ATP diphosphatase HisIE [Alphaproteobacteria bacterium]